MSSVATRIWSQQQVGYCPHTSVSGETWQLTARGTTTGAGAAGGTTLVDTSADSGGADTYNGRYWVKILSGTNAGRWKRIVDDDGSGTLTLENNGFANQVASSVQYEIWLSPEPVVVVDSSSGETDMVDAVRSEADGDNSADFWIGYYAVPITGNRRGKVAKVTAFTPGTGTFVLATGLGGALAAGDVVLLRKFVEVGDLSLGPAQAYHARPANRVNFAVGDGVVGARSGSVGFTVQAQGSGSLAASGSVANVSPCHGLFEACGLEERIGKSATVGAGSNTTAIKIATGSWENFLQAGMAVQHNGNVSFITAITDGAGGVDTITVSPALPVAPTDTDVLYASRMYKKSTDGDVYGCVIEVEVDGIRTTFTGCKGNVEVVGDDVMQFKFTFQADHYTREIEAAPYNPGTAYATTAPTLATDRLVYLDTTKTNVGGITSSPGTVVGPKNVQGSAGINGRSGFHITNYAARLSCRELLTSSGDDLAQESRFLVRTASVVAVVYGSHAGAIAVRLPVARHIEVPHPTNDSDLASVMDVFEAQDAGTYTDPDSVTAKVPDWALHIF